MNTTENSRADRLQPMRPFFTVWLGQVFSLLGSELVQFALVWWLTTTTGSAIVLALATMMAVLPRVFVSPVAGALVDRWNRRAVMMLADSLSALSVVVLAALFAFDAVEVWHVYAVMFVRASCAAFHWPAMQASTTLMVPHEHLARVAGMNQALQGMGAIAAPPLGALLLVVLPMQGVLLIDVATALLAISPLFFIRIPQPLQTVSKEDESQPSLVSDLQVAVGFLRDRPAILLVIGIGVVVNCLVFPALSLQPLLVTQHFGGDALQLAWLQSALGIGMVSGGITLSLWGGFRRRAMTGLLALALNGVGLALVGVVPANDFPLAVGAMFFAWFMNPIANGSLFAVLQTIVPAGMQGRVFTLLNSAAGAMIPLGLVVAGPLADLLGVRFWFLASGIVMMALGVGALFVPAIARLGDTERLRQAGGHDIDEATAVPTGAG